ncbi:hypothetical protein AS149_14175 [Burkholderia cenocepacia]|nr:hypothetical protein AS149_14175 [Burkholderia cenocepacia]
MAFDEVDNLTCVGQRWHALAFSLAKPRMFFIRWFVGPLTRVSQLRFFRCVFEVQSQHAPEAAKPRTFMRL